MICYIIHDPLKTTGRNANVSENCPNEIPIQKVIYFHKINHDITLLIFCFLVIVMHDLLTKGDVFTNTPLSNKDTLGFIYKT